MGRRTAQTQRKIRIPFGLKKKIKKTKADKVEKMSEIENDEVSCQITGCGCGN